MKDQGTITWDELYTEWGDAERTHWQDFYTQKGFDDWEDWRWPMIKSLGLDERKWTLVEPEPGLVVAEVRKMFVNAQTGWTRFAEDRAHATFGHIKGHPDRIADPRITQIRNNFSSSNPLIGLQNQGRTIILEGHHRATAIAGMPEDSSPDVTFAMSEVTDAEFAFLHNGGPLVKAHRRMWDVINAVRLRVRGV